MNRDEIIRMARDAGISKPWDQEPVKWETLERFAALVAAAERERLKWDGLHSCHPECDRPACVHTRKAVEAEREACAKLCHDKAWDLKAEALKAASRARGDRLNDCAIALYEAHEAIRARGQE